MPEAIEYPYALRVGTKAALILGGGGITGGMYELGALSARHGMEVSLERLVADRFLQQTMIPPGRRRFGLTRQQSTAPADDLLDLRH